MIIEINKDIDKYKETVVLGLTVRQLIFSLIALIAGGSIVLLIYPYVGLTVSAYVAIPVVAPIALNGFYSYNGMTFTELMKKKLYYAFMNKPLIYSSTEGMHEVTAIRQEELQENKKQKSVGSFLLNKKNKEGRPHDTFE